MLSAQKKLIDIYTNNTIMPDIQCLITNSNTREYTDKSTVQLYFIELNAYDKQLLVNVKACITGKLHAKQ